MLFFKIGEFFQESSVNRSRRSIKALIAIRPEYANLLRAGFYEKVDPGEVCVGDTIMVKPGERVPLDGVVIDGSSWLDTSALTGESTPRGVHVGEMALAGSVNSSGALTLEVKKTASESSVSRILTLVEEASGRKARTEKFITTFARYYTPVIVGIALLMALTLPFVLKISFQESAYRAFILLVISCPCALVVSIPLGYFGGIGGASRKGILVKGSQVLDALSRIRTVVFDKTGTLTRGLFSVSGIFPQNGFSSDELLYLAAEAEYHSNHPIALSLRNACAGRLQPDDIEKYSEVPGYGVTAFIKGKRVIAGNDRILHREGIDHPVCCVEGTVIHAAVDGVYAGYIILEDEPKADAQTAISEIEKLGLHAILLTGDGHDAAQSLSQRIGIREFHADLLPEDKVTEFEKIQKLYHGKVAFVGDGVNDAPVIARADVGIAMGAFGSDAAVESADCVIMTDSPSKVAEAIIHARRTRRIVIQNIVCALGIKLIFATLGIFGIATMWEAVFADMGVALLAIANAMRVMK
jgi:Cd2+/Zn2+-exporting ATPase